MMFYDVSKLTVLSPYTGSTPLHIEFQILALWFLGPRNNEATIHHELHVGCATCLGTSGWLSEVEESNKPSESMTPTNQATNQKPYKVDPITIYS